MKNINITQKQMEEYYNKNNYYFDHLNKKHQLDYFSYILRLINKIPVNILREDKILEVGSGSGNLINVLVEHKKVPENNIYGVDISFLGLKKHKYGNLVRANATNLPFKDNTFGITIVVDVLEHTLKYQKVIKELYRVTRPGGYIIIRTQNYDCPFLRFEGNDLKIYRRITADRDAVSETSAKEIKRILHSFGGEQKIFQTWLSFNWKIPILRVFNYLPWIKLMGGTCSVLFRKNGNNIIKKENSLFRCPKCHNEFKSKDNYNCSYCHNHYKEKRRIIDLYLE